MDTRINPTLAQISQELIALKAVLEQTEHKVGVNTLEDIINRITMPETKQILSSDDYELSQVLINYSYDEITIEEAIKQIKELVPQQSAGLRWVNLSVKRPLKWQADETHFRLDKRLVMVETLSENSINYYDIVERDYKTVSNEEFKRFEWLDESASHEADNRIAGLEKLLRIADCPEALIKNPSLISSREPSQEDIKWAESIISKSESASPEAVDDKYKAAAMRLVDQIYKKHRFFLRDTLDISNEDKRILLNQNGISSDFFETH